MNSNWQNLEIPIKHLTLWDENARFPDKYFNKNETELVRYFCEKKGKRNLKILDLAEAIIKDIDLPQIEKLIVYKLDDKYIVLEGNRRLVVYKLLNNPNLAPSQILKNKFIELKLKCPIIDSFKLECLITESKVEGFRYIERKHLKRNNEIGWGEQERTNYNKRRGQANKTEEFKSAIGVIMKDLNIPEELTEQILGPGYVTTFWRIIDSSPAWDKFGFKFDKKNSLIFKDKNFREKLKVIIVNVLNKESFRGEKIDSRSLNKKSEIENYIKSISDNDFTKADEAVQSYLSKNIFGEEMVDIAKVKKQKSNPKSLTRIHLIPSTCIFNIKEPKINNIYRELKDDLLLDDTKRAVPNAVGVLFRVFLEISIDCYLDKKCKIVMKKDVEISQKIDQVCDCMENIGVAKSSQLIPIRTLSHGSKKDILHIQRFHEYVHSSTIQPDSASLKAKWDNLQEFFTILWITIYK